MSMEQQLSLTIRQRFTSKKECRFKKNIFFILVISVIIVGAYGCTMPCSTHATCDKSIKSIKALKSEIKEITGGEAMLTTEQKSALVEKTDPKVMEAFIKEKQQLANERFNQINVDDCLKECSDGAMRGSVIIDLGDGYSAKAEFEDAEEASSALARIGESLFEQVYAATNGETLWKSYGKRYFTAKSTRPTGIGACWISLENHYRLSKNGIDERYGVSDSKSLSANATIDEKEPQITDWSAHKPGKSDVNMQCKYRWEVDYPGVGGSGNYIMYTTIKYVDIDKSKEKVKVKHSWKTTW